MILLYTKKIKKKINNKEMSATKKIWKIFYVTLLTDPSGARSSFFPLLCLIFSGALQNKTNESVIIFMITTLGA